jgi:hypothetical protein
MVLDV